MGKYVHLEPNKFVNTLGRLYSPQKEVRLKYKDREVLYVISEVVIETACCGARIHRYIVVPGYIVSWQTEKNKDGLPVSTVEPVTDEKVREELINLISQAERIPQVVFG